NRSPSYADIHRRAVEKFGPATVLVDNDYRIVHLSERANRYLRYAAGEPSHNLFALVLPELRADLRSASLDFSNRDAPTATRAVPLKLDQDAIQVTVTIAPVHDKGSSERLLLIIFEETATSGDDLTPAPAQNQPDGIVARLKDEIETL